MVCRFRQQARAVINGVEAGKVSRERGRELLRTLEVYREQRLTLEEWADDMTRQGFLSPRAGTPEAKRRR